MRWNEENSSKNHCCGCHIKDNRKHDDCGCNKKDDTKHHKSDCYEKRNKCDKCSWKKHRNDNEWRRRCRNRLERVQVISKVNNCDSKHKNGSGHEQEDCNHKKRKKR